MKNYAWVFLISFVGFASNTYGQPQAPIGQWKCVVNSYWGGAEVLMRVAPNYSLYGRGVIIYAGTSASYQVQGNGDWAMLPPDQHSSQWLFKFRMFPANHRIFDWYARPTGNPNWLYNTFQNQNGAVTETSCNRVG